MEVGRRGRDLEGCRDRSLGSAADHAALRVQEAQVGIAEPIPARDDIDLRLEVQRGHGDHLAKRLGRAQGQADDQRQRQQADGVGRRQADGSGALRQRDGDSCKLASTVKQWVAPVTSI